MAINDFPSADLRNMTTAELTALAALLATAITNYLTGGASVQKYTITGRSVERIPLTELVALQGAVRRALAIQTAEPDGIGIGLARRGEPQ